MFVAKKRRTFSHDGNFIKSHNEAQMFVLWDKISDEIVHWCRIASHERSNVSESGRIIHTSLYYFHDFYGDH